MGSLDTTSPFNFRLDSSRDDEPVKATCIPTEKIIEDARWRYVVGVIDAANATWGATTSPIQCTYRDPCVIEVPAALGGGWLMLLTRYWNTDVVATGTTFDSASRSQDQTISEIIAYYSPVSASFTGSRVQGPYLVVDSMQAVGYRDAVSGEEVVSPLRCHPEMPTGQFVEVNGEWQLFLYYAAPLSAMRGWDVANQVETWTDGYQPSAYEASGADTAAAMATFDNGTGWSRTLAMKQVSGQTVLDEIINNTTPEDERDWGGGNNGLTAVKYRMVRLWLATGPAMARITEVLADRIEINVATNLQDNVGVAWTSGGDLIGFTDPEAALQDDQLLLFVRATFTIFSRSGWAAEDYLNPIPGGSLTGVWRTAAVEDGFYLSAIGEFAEYGRDFIVLALDADGLSDDLIAGDYFYDDNRHFPISRVTIQFADPDAVHVVVDGIWLVYLHNGQVLQMVEAPSTDVGRNWADAW